MIYYIYSPNDREFVETVKTYLADQEVEYFSVDTLGSVDMDQVSHLLVTGCLDEIKMVMTLAYENEVSIGIIPNPK